MERTDATTSISRSLSGINMIIGIWMIISSYILNSPSQSNWPEVIAGVVVIALAGTRYLRPEFKWASYINILVAALMIVVPFSSGDPSGIGYWNDIFTALVLGVAAIWNSGLDSRSLHHGHTA